MMLDDVRCVDIVDIQMFFVSHILSNYQGLIVSMVPESAKRNVTPSCTKATQRSASSIYVA